MKKVIMALCLIWSLAFVSCENWLDVKPKAEIKWDVFFETEQGFKDALLGCYLRWGNDLSVLGRAGSTVLLYEYQFV